MVESLAYRTHNEEFYEVQESHQLPLLKPATAALGENLQLRAPTSVFGIPHAAGIHRSWETQSQKGKVSLIYWTSTRTCWNRTFLETI